MLQEIMTTKDGTMFHKEIKEVLTEPSKTPKDFIRFKIENEVFDEKDSLADTTKWLSLLTTLVSNMYEIFTETQKAKLGTDNRALIEYTFAKFKETNTRGDIQFQSEGIAMIDKLLSRQAKIGEIIK